uniref:Uncharacterized protein n=1 Tax=Anguilla anguilla TaxID=7936 RepID=A0A0E9WGK8_ANGAN
MHRDCNTECNACNMVNIFGGHRHMQPLCDHSILDQIRDMQNLGKKTPLTANISQKFSMQKRMQI